jgi:predicted extracellular nuclease
VPDRIAASGTTLDPAHNALDFFESLEGMRVSVPDALVVGALHGATVTVVADGGASSEPRTDAGGVELTASDPNPERIVVDTSALDGVSPVDVGARLTGPVTGVVDYRSGRYVVLADGIWPDAAPSSFTRRTTTLEADAAHWSIATLNAYNFSPTDAAHVRAVGDFIATSLRAPDVVALQEVQDDNGTAVGELDATHTLDALSAAIAIAGGPAYGSAQISPAAEDADGGEHGGNIRVAYLFRTDRVRMTTFGVAGPDDAVTVTNDHGAAHLAPLPGRIAPDDPAFDGSRKPLVAEFWRGPSRLVTIAVHLSSRLGDDPIFGAVQPPRSPSSAKRRAQAKVVAEFVQRVQSIEADAPVVVLGDFNDFEYSPALTTLTAAPLTDVTAGLPVATRYSYVYEGNSQLFDHVLVSTALAPRTQAEIVHANADFADAERCSDHDAVVVRIAMKP